MAFPDDPLDINVDLYYTDQWNAVPPAEVRGLGTEDGSVKITRGVRDEASESLPTRINLALDNRTGKYTLRYPLSALYGKIGYNTPIRVHVGEPHLGNDGSSTTDTTSHVAPSLSSPTDDALLLCAWAAPAPAGSYTEPASMTAGPTATDASATIGSGSEAISAAGATGTRTATFSATEDYAAASVLLHGTTPTVADSGSGTDSVTVTAATGDWLAVFAWFGWLEVEDTHIPGFPWDTSNAGGWMLMADTGTVWADDVQAEWMRMKAWAKRVVTTGDADRTIHLYGVGEVDSTLMVAFVVADAADWLFRGHGEIPAWPNRWDVSGNDIWTPIQGAGVLRRLGQGEEALESPIFREALSVRHEAHRVAYWPCEDGRDATTIASALPGANAMRTFGTVRFADYDEFAGSKPILTLAAGAWFFARVRPYAAGLTHFSGLYAVPAAGMVNASHMLDLPCAGGTVARVRILYGTASSGTLNMQLLDDGDALLNETTGLVYLGGVNGKQFQMTIMLDQVGADIDWEITLREPGSGAETTFDGTFAGRTFGRAHSVRVGGTTSGGMADCSVGHLMIGSSRRLVEHVQDAVDGWAGEHAGRRFLRLCFEQGIDAAVVGDPDDTQPMGPQAVDTLTNLLREIGRTDDGVLYEPREYLGLALRTGRSRYNQYIGLTLAYGTTGEVAHPFQPVPDDQLTRNDVTADRPGGSSARAVKTTGPLNVNPRVDDSQGVGRYKTQVNVNPQSDGDLLNHAQWHLLKGTIDEDRFPAVNLNLAHASDVGNTELVQDAAHLDVADRLLVTDPPELRTAPEDISQLALGFSELLNQKQWEITLNTVPESPMHIAEVTHATYGFAQSDSATKNGAGNSTQTSINIRFGAGPDWVYEADFDILIGGERMTVTAVGAIAGSFPSRTASLTVVRSVNGVVKAIADGAQIFWFHKSYIGL